MFNHSSTMSNAAAIDYRNTLFEFKELKKIHGEPTYEGLKVLVNQLKSNAQAVSSPLGDGMHGYLALVLSPRQYATVSNVPFVRPMAPGPLTIPPVTLPNVAIALQAQHAEQVRIFQECNGVEKALKQQLVEAIDGEYLIALRNRSTNAIMAPLYDVLNFLFVQYGKVTSTMLDDAEMKVKRMAYDPRHPVDIVFNAVEDLHDYSHAANSIYTQQQLINMAYNIFLKTGTFKSAIREWNKKPAAEKTWVSFKVHFRSAQQELKETNSLSTENANLNQAHFVQQVVDGLQEALKPTEEENNMADEYMNNVANMATNNQQLLPTFLQQMQEMQKMMNDMQQQLANSQSNNNTRTRRQTTRRNTSKYCWSHGACSHSSKDCNSKRDGHQDNATFENKMGGSTYYCK